MFHRENFNYWPLTKKLVQLLYVASFVGTKQEVQHTLVAIRLFTVTLVKKSDFDEGHVYCWCAHIIWVIDSVPTRVQCVSVVMGLMSQLKLPYVTSFIGFTLLLTTQASRPILFATDVFHIFLCIGSRFSCLQLRYSPVTSSQTSWIRSCS